MEEEVEVAIAVVEVAEQKMLGLLGLGWYLPKPIVGILASTLNRWELSADGVVLH